VLAWILRPLQVRAWCGEYSMRTRRTLLWRRPDGSAHPHSRDEFGASGGDGISDDKGRMHAVAWGLSVRPPRHQLDWTLKVTSAGEGP
jgi:hypothetical protein